MNLHQKVINGKDSRANELLYLFMIGNSKSILSLTHISISFCCLLYVLVTLRFTSQWVFIFVDNWGLLSQSSPSHRFSWAPVVFGICICIWYVVEPIYGFHTTGRESADGGLYWSWFLGAVLNASKEFACTTLFGRWSLWITVSTRKECWYCCFL